MNTYENLVDTAEKNGLQVLDYPFVSDKLKGLYCDDKIAIRAGMSECMKKCVLAEELGHYHTTVGNIIDLSEPQNRKQERRARIWAYNKLIGINGLINAYKYGCCSKFEIAEFLEVTEDFLSEVLHYYKNKHGICTVVDNYVIYFEPTIGVLELI